MLVFSVRDQVLLMPNQPTPNHRIDKKSPNRLNNCSGFYYFSKIILLSLLLSPLSSHGVYGQRNG